MNRELFTPMKPSYFSFPGLKVPLVSFTPKDILQRVALWYNLLPGQIKTAGRQYNICEARQVCMYIMRIKSGMTVVDIGRFFDGKHYTSVIHAVSKVRGLIEAYPSFRAKVETIMYDKWYEPANDLLTNTEKVIDKDAQSNSGRPPAEYSNRSAWGIATEFNNQKSAS